MAAKAERDRRSKEKRLLEQQQAAKAAALIPDRRSQEMDMIERNVLQKCKFELIEMTGDGDCLFASIAHQLNFLSPDDASDVAASTSDTAIDDDLSTSEKSELEALQSDDLQITWTAVKLRELAAKQLLKHKEHYVNFLFDTEHASVEDYCVDLLVPGRIWGGHLELDALAHALDRCIAVHQAEGEPLYFNRSETDDPSKLILNICYRQHAYSLGAHYDSLQPQNASL